ncbi:aldose 1-epimerase [Oscillibacter sp. PC13]|uniref:aldose epimerase family protein n=1 Tax=Oscillibacter sp. PC13 TaxID=1855299 RepID=UPI0008EA6D0A|nr:aldose epimerase family protein [Oscillibacter sp. PC13]SFP65898.1 aldose 1-epimerase [Oscillibacter sp. PC13]
MVKTSPFGSVNGKPVTLLTLSDNTGTQVELLSLGAAIRSIVVPDRCGTLTDICLGYDSPGEYWEQDACFGGIIGRCANRIAGASFSLNGQEWQLTANEGVNHLHGGTEGFHRRHWEFLWGDSFVTFIRSSLHLEEGYPGLLQVEVTYTLRDGCLGIYYRAHSDRDTVVNLTNHAYFNLAGHTGGPVDDHMLTVRASRYTPCREDNIPTGELQDVAGTPLDLRCGVRLGDRLETPLLTATRGFDHNLVLDMPTGAPEASPAATLWCPSSGIGMEVCTTLEGIQIYTAGFLTPRDGKGGVRYGPRHAVCLETQHFPDAVHHAGFPSPILRAGEEYRHFTKYRFFVKTESICKRGSLVSPCPAI